MFGMDSARYADRKISEAHARGEMEPQEGVGKPMRDLTSDPDWWIRAFLEREQMPKRFSEMSASVLERTDLAVGADNLASAREHLARANAEARRWNEHVDAVFQIEERSEIWLVTQRARRPVT